MSIGYTPKQAAALERKINKAVAKIEDAAAELRHAVPDCDVNRFSRFGGVDGLLEEFREIERGLCQTIDRRTQS